MIKTVNMNVETQEYDTLMISLESRIAELGGYIEYLESYNGSSYGGQVKRNVTMTVRIPQENLSAFVSSVSDLANIVRRMENVEDITLENRLTSIRYQIERMESQLRTYDNKVDYSTVYLRIDEVQVYTSVKEETPWERMVNSPYLLIWGVVIAVIVCLARSVAVT